MGLPQDSPVGATSGDRGPTTFGSHRGCRWPETRPGPSVVTGTADLDGTIENQGLPPRGGGASGP